MKRLTIWIALLCLLASGCDETPVIDKTEISPPVLTEFTPKRGSAGTEIKITGDHLQDVDTVLIGGGVASISQRVNSKELYVKVNGASRTGIITIKNSVGETSGVDNFTVDYLVPKLEVIPSSAEVKDIILIEGENMHAVADVYFGEVKGKIEMQDKEFLKVEVPLFSDETPVDITLTYNDESGEKKVSTTGKPFQLVIIHPMVTTIPQIALEGTEIEISGDNLNVVDSVMFGDTKLTIIEQSKELIKIRTPFIPAEMGESIKAPLALAYLYELSLIIVSEFEVTKTQMDAPVFTSFPSSAIAGATITLEGTDLMQIDQILFGSTTGKITLQTNTELAVTVPDIPAGEMILKAIYRGDQEIIITETFTIAMMNVTARKGVELFCPYSPDANFYSISLNKTYSPCEYVDNAADIQAFIYRSAGGLQLIDPQNSNGASKFFCGESSDKLTTSGKAPKIRFKKVNPDNPAEKVFHDMVKEGTLTYISEDDIRAAGLLSGLKQVVRYRNGGVPDDDDLYNQTNDEGTYIGGVNLLVEYETDGSTIKRLGFVELMDVKLDFDTEPSTGNEIEKSSMTFNFYITD